MKKIKHNKEIEKDIKDSLYFLKDLRKFLKLFFFSLLGIRIIKAILIFSIIKTFRSFYLFFILKNDNLKTYKFEDCLCIGDSTISYPTRDGYYYPYLFFNEGYIKNMFCMATPGLNNRLATNFILENEDKLKIENRKFDLIILSTFQSGIINPSLNLEDFERGSKVLFHILTKKLKGNGKIILIWGDFSKHPTISDNYYKKYFMYKTYKFLEIIEKLKNKNLIAMELMNLENDSQKKRESYICFDKFHFSKKGQDRLLNDFKKELIKNKLI